MNEQERALARLSELATETPTEGAAAWMCETMAAPHFDAPLSVRQAAQAIFQPKPKRSLVLRWLGAGARASATEVRQGEAEGVLRIRLVPEADGVELMARAAPRSVLVIGEDEFVFDEDGRLEARLAQLPQSAELWVADERFEVSLGESPLA